MVTQTRIDRRGRLVGGLSMFVTLKRIKKYTIKEVHGHLPSTLPTWIMLLFSWFCFGYIELSQRVEGMAETQLGSEFG